MTSTSASTIDLLLAGIAWGAVPTRLLTDGAVLHAVVADRRFAATGSTTVAGGCGRWFHPERPAHVGPPDRSDA